MKILKNNSIFLRIMLILLVIILGTLEIFIFRHEFKEIKNEMKLKKETSIFIQALSSKKKSALNIAQEMMAEIEEEMARAAALKAFQDKLAADKAAAAKSTAAYQSKLARDAEMAARMEELAIEQELAIFEAKLAAEQAAADMMAEIEAEMARAAALKAFQDKLAADKAAAAAATAAYRASLEEEVVGELVVEDEVIVVTEAAHEACKHALGLTDANIALFESALADGTLFNKGPQSANGTEFGASRWDAYANCVSNYVNPF